MTYNEFGGTLSLTQSIILTVLWIGFCHTGPISLCIDSFVFSSVYFVRIFSYCIMRCIIVTRWGGPGGIEA